MGGYGALRFVLKYPETFAAAGLLSPAIYDPEPPQASGARRVGVFGAPEFDPQVWQQLNYPALWDAFLAKKIAVPMYINSGDDDDYFIEAEATRLYTLLGEVQTHFGLQLCRRDPQPFGRARCLQRDPHESTAFEDTSPAIPMCHAESALAIEEDPADRHGSFRIRVFCIHRIYLSIKSVSLGRMRIHVDPTDLSFADLAVL
jgi:pimeloyl-ACP methyl ester carboxylesterase